MEVGGCMTQDDVIDMARQAQVHEELCGEHFIYEFAKLAFEKGRQQGMQQERALWELSKSTQEIGL